EYVRYHARVHHGESDVAIGGVYAFVA
ncbi:MAG: hypothetical protein JWO52_435, partial [Gammaproteobacteria bacterium]|nr:hypothetical protein [Gammaproteobacteria bacterium]